MLYGELADFRGGMCASPALTDVISFLAEKAPSLDDGRHELNNGIWGELKRYAPAPAAGRSYEAHVKYVDVQYVFEGEEVVYVRPLAGLKKKEEFADRDLTFYEEPESGPEFPVYLRPGVFLVLFPDDAHKTECRLGATTGRKAIMKIPHELLAWR